ncbi:MAG: hypothetical protein OXC44_05040 [Proteobacteria bacterium]|nr:hypothetical protein [Pseudomonadota bacterium]
MQLFIKSTSVFSMTFLILSCLMSGCQDSSGFDPQTPRSTVLTNNSGDALGDGDDQNTEPKSIEDAEKKKRKENENKSKTSSKNSSGTPDSSSTGAPSGSTNLKTDILQINNGTKKEISVKILWFVEKTKNHLSGSNSKNQNIIKIQDRIGPFINNWDDDDQIDVTVTFVGPVQFGFLSGSTESIPGINSHVDLQIYRNNRYNSYSYSHHQHSEFLLNAMLLLAKDHIFSKAGIDSQSIGITNSIGSDDLQSLATNINTLFDPFYGPTRQYERLHIKNLLNFNNSKYRHHLNNKFILYDSSSNINSEYISDLKDYFNPTTHFNIIINHIHNYTFSSPLPSNRYISNADRLSNETFRSFLFKNYNISDLSSFRNYTYTSTGSGLTHTQMSNNPFYDLTKIFNGHTDTFDRSAQYFHTGSTDDDIDSFFRSLKETIKKDATFKYFTLKETCTMVDSVVINNKTLPASPYLYSCDNRSLKINAEKLKNANNIVVKYY